MPDVVTIYFVAIEPEDQAFFGDRLDDHDLIAVERLADVDEDAEIVCIFIDHKIGHDFLAAHPKLRLLATRSSSIDHIDLDACRTTGVPVCNVPHYGEEAVAEHTFALMLALARRLRALMEMPKAGAGTFSYEATRSIELHGKTLGIIGMGRIGQRLCTLAHAFQMQVISFDVEHPVDLSSSLHFRWVSLEQLLAQSDFISLHAALSPSTYHIINAQTLAQTKRGVFIINTARGALIDTLALRDALDSGHVGGAGLDVLQDERVMRRTAPDIISAEILRHMRSDALASEARDADRVQELRDLMLSEALLTRPNVVFTPHIAFNTHEAVHRLNEVTAANLRGFVEGMPQNLVPNKTPPLR